jgi:hypothetical protein
MACFAANAANAVPLNLTVWYSSSISARLASVGDLVEPHEREGIG